MDGLRRRVRHGCLPSRGASPGRDAAASEARAQTADARVTTITQFGGRTKKATRAALSCTARVANVPVGRRSEEHTSELQSLMRISYAVFCLKKKNTKG